MVIPEGTTPKLLGVTLDHALAFRQHIAKLATKATGRCLVLTSLTSKKEGLEETPTY